MMDNLPGKSHYRRSVFDLIHCLYHILQFYFVRGGHDDDVGYTRKVCQVEGAMVGGTIVTHQTRTIEHHSHLVQQDRGNKGVVTRRKVKIKACV